MKISAFKTMVMGGALALTGFSTSANAVNFLTNGDFSAGNTGFVTDYDYISAHGSFTMGAEGTYAVDDNPFDFHSAWVDLGNTDNPALILNGSPDAGAVVFGQDGILAGAGKYKFSANVMNICCNASYPGPNYPSKLLFEVNIDNGGWTSLASYLTVPGVHPWTPASGDAGVLGSTSGTFILASAGSFSIRALNDITELGGNDFLLDNLVVSAVPEPATWTMLIAGFGLIGFAMRRRPATKSQASYA